MASSSRPSVALARHDGTFGSFAKTLELRDGLQGFKPADKVLLKPNVLWGGSRSNPQFGRVTTSTMVGYTLQALRECGCTEVAIGEGSAPVDPEAVLGSIQRVE